jgi:hypothetical protein
LGLVLEPGPVLQAVRLVQVVVVGALVQLLFVQPAQEYFWALAQVL